MGDGGLDIKVKGTVQPLHNLSLLTRLPATECVSEHGKAMCKDISGKCITISDGYYSISALCMVVGVIILVTFVIPRALKLQGQSIIRCAVKVLMHIHSPSNIGMAGKTVIDVT